MAVGRDVGRALAGIKLAVPVLLPMGAAGECWARPWRVQSLGSLLPMIFLGTLNQANTRNWATAVVRHADFYTLLNKSTVLQFVFTCHFLCPSQIVSTFALE